MNPHVPWFFSDQGWAHVSLIFRVGFHETEPRIHVDGRGKPSIPYREFLRFNAIWEALKPLLRRADHSTYPQYALMNEYDLEHEIS